jgi:hypothetical protein
MPFGVLKQRLTDRQRVGALAGAVLALVAASVVAIAVIDPGGQSTAKPPDSCNVLGADAVAKALGTPPGRVVAVPRPPDPEGDRCNYEDKDTRKLLFFVRVEESKDRAQSLQLAQTLTGTPVPGVGEVARYDQTPTRSQITAFAGRRWVFMTSVASAVPQDRMATLARQAIAHGTRLTRS